MRQEKIILFCALIISLAGSCSRIPSQKTVSREQELARIEQLHQKDIAATLAGDPAALAELWTDDAVRLEPGGQTDIGRQAIRSADERMKADHPQSQAISYVPDIKDVRIEGAVAYEWGTFTGSFKDTPDGEVKSFRGKLLRVLQKQNDGSWKFTRVMWTMAE